MRVLIAGGGVAGLETLLALHALAENRVELTVIAPEDEFVYRPLAVNESYALESDPVREGDEVALLPPVAGG